MNGFPVGLRAHSRFLGLPIGSQTLEGEACGETVAETDWVEYPPHVVVRRPT